MYLPSPLYIMLIPEKKSYWLDGIEYQSDKVIFTHVQQVDHIQKSISDIRESKEGHSYRKEYKHIARIPDLLFLKIQHIIAPEGRIDEKALNKWLATDEGRPYRVARD